MQIWGGMHRFLRAGVSQMQHLPGPHSAELLMWPPVRARHTIVTTFSAVPIHHLGEFLIVEILSEPQMTYKQTPSSHGRDQKFGGEGN